MANFARKYRPSRLSDYIGNEKLVTSVMKMMQVDVKPQVLLFKGHTGCGKTTMARLVAKEYMCENRSDETGACNECESCILANEYIETGDDGLFLNLREYDIAKDGGKDTIDAIIAEAEAPSLDDGWKIFIFDECHRATKQAQNSLLKLAEEPPEKVLLMFCTTDAEIMLPTLLNRCTYKFTVTKPTVNNAVTLLARVCIAEGVEYDNKGLSIIATRSGCVYRECLSRLEQVINEKSSAKYDDVVDVLSVVADTYFYNFFRYLAECETNVYEFLSFIGKVKEEMDLKVFVKELLDFTLRAVYITHGINTQGVEPKELKTVSNIMHKFKGSEIAEFLAILLDLKVSVYEDIEPRLLSMAYNRAFKKAVGVEATSTIVDVMLEHEAEDKKKMDSTRISNIYDSQHLTEEATQVLMQDAQKECSEDDLMSLFGAKKVEL